MSATPRLPAVRNGQASNGLVLSSDPIELGRVLAASGFFSDSRGAAQAAVKVMAGAELGFGPVASMTGVYIVKGRVTLSANLMAAAIKRHPAYSYRVTEHTAELCTIDFIEEGKVIGTSSFSMDDARAAGLAGSDTYKKHPRNMLFARALSNGAKWHCPDAFGGGPIYTPDELGATVDGETGEVIEAPVIERAPNPEPEPESVKTITLGEAVALASAAFRVVAPNALALAATHVSGRDLGDFSTEEAAVIALQQLTVEQATKLSGWLSQKADKLAFIEAEGDS